MYLRRNESKGGRPSDDYFLTISEALQIVRHERRYNSAELYNYLLKFQGKDTYIIRENKRKEYDFGELLESILNGIVEGSKKGLNNFKYNPLKILKQANYKNGKYRVDFLLPSFSLIIEYDEKHHEHQKEEDFKRMREINKEFWLLEGCEDHKEPCKWVRVKEGNELDGIKEIMKELSHQEFGF